MKSNKTGNYYECRQNAVRGLKTYLDQLEHMCQTHIILCGPREHMMVLKIKIYAALYRKLWKCIPVTQVSDSIWHSIYKQKWTLVRIWYAVVRIRGVGFFGWWRLRGSCILKGIKRTSSSAPPTEKHDILDSRIKKSIVACLRWFLWSYCNDKCPERISLCERALNARAQISLLSSGFLHSHRKRMHFLSARLTCVRSKNIFSPEFNKHNLECGHPLAETYIGAYAS